MRRRPDDARQRRAWRADRAGEARARIACDLAPQDCRVSGLASKLSAATPSPLKTTLRGIPAIGARAGRGRVERPRVARQERDDDVRRRLTSNLRRHRRRRLRLALTPADWAECGQRNARNGRALPRRRYLRFDYGIKPKCFRITRSTIFMRRSASSRILNTVISLAGHALTAAP